MSKDELIKLKKELKDSCISLTKFLINYCGITSKNLHNIKISHQDIKELMPQLKRVSFESLLEDKNSFYKGDIIPVKDCYGNVVPYVNPVIEYDIIIEFDCEVTENENELENIVVSENLNHYELIKLCRFYKEHNRLKDYRIVHKLLKEEKETKGKQYKMEKYNLIMEGREENDKY